MNQKPDFEAFANALSSLKIEVSQSEDGVLTVCSSSEPFFCYDAHDHDALNQLVVDTLRSYGRYFYGIDDPNLTTRCSPVGEIIPVERSKRISTIEPVLEKAA